MIPGLVSILIVTYEAEKYIKETIDSCLRQTYKNTEILILDNNSSDNTVSIIRSIYSAKLRLYAGGTNIGPFGGLNYLISRASGEYVAIQDHDDLWFPDKIEKQIDFLSENKGAIACGTRTFYYYEGLEKFVLNKKKFLTNCYDHTSLLFRNAGFKYEEKHALADQYFQKITLKKKGDVACLSDILAIHRIREDNKNYSNYVFGLTFKNLRELIFLNGINKNSLFFFASILATKILPISLFHKVALRIFRGNLVELTMIEFKKKYPKSGLFQERHE